MESVCERLGVGSGSLAESFHRLARLMVVYLQEPALHVDEPGWWINRHNMYNWLFATPQRKYWGQS